MGVALSWLWALGLIHYHLNSEFVSSYSDGVGTDPVIYGFSLTYITGMNID